MPDEPVPHPTPHPGPDGESRIAPERPHDLSVPSPLGSSVEPPAGESFASGIARNMSDSVSDVPVSIDGERLTGLTVPHAEVTTGSSGMPPITDAAPIHPLQPETTPYIDRDGSVNDEGTTTHPLSLDDE